LLGFHTAAYLAELKEADEAGRWFGRTTYLPAGGMRGVRLAAGAAIEAARDVAAGRERIAYALVRPPFHHAQPDRADGYCFVNGVGLAALAAIDAGCKRVAIIDWDVHHGNGTQEGFYDRDDVLTISLHMDHGSWGAAAHPQTGGVEEIGVRAGEGFNLNLPLTFGAGDHAYALAFERCVEPVVRKFAPDLLVLANGQDANQFDPNGRQMLTMAGFHHLASRLRGLANELSGGRIAVTQEGGYNVAYAPFCAYAVAAGLIGRDLEIPDPLAFYPEDQARAEADIEALIERHPLLG
jgi:acetoin utilization deacetylase AcuC-like enzyme